MVESSLHFVPQWAGSFSQHSSRCVRPQKKGSHHWNVVCHCNVTQIQNHHRADTALQLTHQDGSQIQVFGIDHLKSQYDAAEHILMRRPAAVVVETSVSRTHGLATRNILTVQSPSENRLTQVCQQLGRMLHNDPTPQHNPQWKAVKSSYNLPGEQLAYIAAFAVNADLIFGDRPKEETYHRLLNATSLSDLDHAFGIQSWLNYQEKLEDKAVASKVARPLTLVDHITFTEREMVFCDTLKWAANQGRGEVVGIVGEDHLAGIQRLWEGQESQSESGSTTLAEGVVSEGSEFSAYSSKKVDRPAMGSRQGSTNKPTLEPHEEVGVHRALLESVIRLKAIPSVVTDLKHVLGELPPESWEPYCWAFELYASPRMLLASLSRDQLGRVCSGWNCDMWEVLQPLRAARPVNGGTGYDIDLAIRLRELAIDFS